MLVMCGCSPNLTKTNKRYSKLKRCKEYMGQIEVIN